MRALVGMKVEHGYKKVGVYRVRKNGSVVLPAKFHGKATVESTLFRAGVRTCFNLSKDAPVNFVEVQYGSSPTYRISLIQ